MSEPKPVLIGGSWVKSDSVGSFSATNPTTGVDFEARFPISSWEDCCKALDAATEAYQQIRTACRSKIAAFLNAFADQIEKNAEDICQAASDETGLPFSPRLKDIELPRTTGQLRQAAAAVIDGSWSMPTIDSANNIRSMHRSIGPVIVFGPNNFPLAFNGISGGDFAAAIAAGNPVIVKGHPNHPETTQKLADAALAALTEAGLPESTVQLLYHMNPEDGLRLVADDRTAASAFTGGRPAGLALKEACDKAGKPIYLELSSVNPVVMLPGVLNQRSDDLVDEFSGSCMMAAGQFCTNPGLVVLQESEKSESFIEGVVERFKAAAPGTLLSKGVKSSLADSVQAVAGAGATVLTGGSVVEGGRLAFENSILRVSGDDFLANRQGLQTEMFGPVSLFVVVKNVEQAKEVLMSVEGNLTGTIYSATDGSDDEAYKQIEPVLRAKVGRLTNDKMPTGVAVSSAMNHGGPYPSTGHSGFSAVGMPGTIRRFTALQCYDNVRPDRLPCLLKDAIKNNDTWRLVDGNWTQGSIA